MARSVSAGIGERPRRFPSLLALAKPALTRSWIMARSNSARPAACSTNASGFLLTNEVQSMDKGVPLKGSWEATMKLARRQFLHLAAGAATMPAVLRVARAQACPTRPVTMVVAFRPGSVSSWSSYSSSALDGGMRYALRQRRAQALYCCHTATGAARRPKAGRSPRVRSGRC